MAVMTKDREILLEPGDIVKVQYQINGANEQLIALAIHQVKSTLSADKRFNYQGSEITTQTYSDMGYESELRFLDVYIQVAKKQKEYSRPVTAESGTGVKTTESTGVKQAGVPAGGILGISMKTLLGLLSGAVVSYSAALVYHDYVINGIVNSTQPPEVKEAGLKALGKGGIGEGITALGSSLTIGLIVLGVLWLAGQPKGGSGE